MERLAFDVAKEFRKEVAQSEKQKGDIGLFLLLFLALWMLAW